MTDAPFALLAETAAAWGLPLTDEQIAQFAAYADELRRWNAHTNLTRIIEPTDMVVRLFLDALACAQHWGAAPHRLADLGSGAGFPGLPLKILRPALRLTLVESVGKKAAFLRHIVAHLGLSEVQVLQARAEAVGHDPAHRAAYDVVTARAVAELRVLAEYGLPLLRSGGRLLAPKGADIDAELAATGPALHKLGGHLLAVEPVVLPGHEPRPLVIIRKTGTTPAAYPRAVGVPARRPL
jgi:16S rRNA (guanine527-N7)-methyltransferase